MGEEYRATSYRPGKLVRRIIGPAFISKPSSVPLQQDQMKTVRALWDTGATGSVVTASMAKELDLVPIDQMETLVFMAPRGFMFTL